MQITAIDIASLHPSQDPFMLLGRIEHCKLQWGGQFKCVVQTSVGSLQALGNRDVLLGVEEGSWLALRLQRDAQDVRMVSCEPGSPLVHAAWLPVVPCPQPQVLRRLRLLLGRLSAASQALFMKAMPGAATQRNFFKRPAASDHHNFPGGLFAQSVHAAELAYETCYDSETEREAATLVALLFDLGKVVDPAVDRDFPRAAAELEPHSMTRVPVLPACDLLERYDPDLARRVRGLLIRGSNETDDLLYQRVRHAVERSWTATSFIRKQGTQ
jgi:hypothetical protein